MGEHATHKWLPRLKDAGIEFLSITPCRDDTADYLDAEWWAPRPNSDVALMLGLAHTLYVEKLHDEVFLAQYCVGFERFSAYLTGETDGQQKTAGWAAEISGITAESIRALARKMAANRTMHRLFAAKRRSRGAVYWMVALAAMLGKSAFPAGCGFGYGSMNGTAIQQCASLRPTCRPVKPCPNFIPVARVPIFSSIRAAPSIQWRRPHLSRYPSRILVHGGNLPSPSRFEQACRSVATSRDDYRQRALVDINGALCRHCLAGHNDGGAQRYWRQFSRSLLDRNATSCRTCGSIP